MHSAERVPIKQCSLINFPYYGLTIEAIILLSINKKPFVILVLFVQMCM